MIESIGRAAISVGADGIFIETHPEPSKAKSDGANMLKLSELENLLCKLQAIQKTINLF
jgi:2-dehydro-3-deoxyphosphooctonate aldolase (KDO 8-P synthase)